MPKRMQDLPEEYLTSRRRKALHLTQEQLRARLELEQVYISRSEYSRIENGDVLLDVAELIALRSILDVPFDWLLAEDGER
jgi:transcriptional regulator with XRE-family HTH domain